MLYLDLVDELLKQTLTIEVDNHAARPRITETFAHRKVLMRE